MDGPLMLPLGCEGENGGLLGSFGDGPGNLGVWGVNGVCGVCGDPVLVGDGTGLFFVCLESGGRPPG